MACICPIEFFKSNSSIIESILGHVWDKIDFVVPRTALVPSNKASFPNNEDTTGVNGTNGNIIKELMLLFYNNI